MPSPLLLKRERENVFHYLLVTRLPKQPPSDCPPFSANKGQPPRGRRIYIYSAPARAPLWYSECYPAGTSDGLQQQTEGEGISDESHDHPPFSRFIGHVGVRTLGMCDYVRSTRYGLNTRIKVIARDCTAGVNGLRMLIMFSQYYWRFIRCQKGEIWNAKNIRRKRRAWDRCFCLDPFHRAIGASYHYSMRMDMAWWCRRRHVWVKRVQWK
jgi:hypothetical protein